MNMKRNYYIFLKYIFEKAKFSLIYWKKGYFIFSSIVLFKSMKVTEDHAAMKYEEYFKSEYKIAWNKNDNFSRFIIKIKMKTKLLQVAKYWKWKEMNYSPIHYWIKPIDTNSATVNMKFSTFTKFFKMIQN